MVWLWFALGLIAAFLFGANAVVVRYLALQGVSPFWIAFGRLAIGALALYPFLLLTGETQVFKIRKRLLVAVASLSVAANFFLFHYGLTLTFAGSAMVLEATSPIFALLILALVFGDESRKKEVLSVVIAATGIFLVVFSPNPADQSAMFLGNLFEIGAAVTWAVFVVCSKKLLDHQKPLSALVQVFTISAALLTPTLFFINPISLDSALLIVALGLFSTALGYILYYEALKRVSAITGMLLFALSLFFAILLGSAVLGENLPFNAFIGVMLILIAIFLSKKEEHPAKTTTSVNKLRA